MNFPPLISILVIVTLALAGCSARDNAASAQTPPASTQGAQGASSLTGTRWRLESIAGASVVGNRVQATLEFLEGGRVSGGGSCNRFSGPVEISGQSIKLGALISTLMACGEAADTQERKYLDALRDAERFAREGTALLIYSRGAERPLRFVPLAP